MTLEAASYTPNWIAISPRNICSTYWIARQTSSVPLPEVLQTQSNSFGVMCLEPLESYSRIMSRNYADWLTFRSVPRNGFL